MPNLTPTHLIYAALLAGSIAGIAGVLRLLSFGGALAAFVIGFFVFGFGGLTFAAPLLAFFFSSSLLSRLGRARKAMLNAQYAKSSTRDALQVLANGGVAAALAFAFAFTPASRQCFLLYLGALAAVNADTWATEVGGLAGGRPRLVTTFRKVEPGVSGAVSWLGLAAALTGAFFIAGVAWAVWPPRSTLFFFRIDAAEILAITWAGFVASFLDSILGATLQIQYRCPRCSALTERPTHCGAPSVPARGLRWFTNDAVNFVTSAMGAAFAWFLLQYFAYPI